MGGRRRSRSRSRRCLGVMTRQHPQMVLGLMTEREPARTGRRTRKRRSSRRRRGGRTRPLIMTDTTHPTIKNKPTRQRRRTRILDDSRRFRCRVPRPLIMTSLPIPTIKNKTPRQRRRTRIRLISPNHPRNNTTLSRLTLILLFRRRHIRPTRPNIIPSHRPETRKHTTNNHQPHQQQPPHPHHTQPPTTKERQLSTADGILDRSRRSPAGGQTLPRGSRDATERRRSGGPPARDSPARAHLRNGSPRHDTTTACPSPTRRMTFGELYLCAYVRCVIQAEFSMKTRYSQ